MTESHGLQTAPVYVLSLPDAQERRDNVRRLLDDLNIPHRFHDALNGRQLGYAFFSGVYNVERIKKTFKRALSPGEIACAEGHRQIWRDIAAGPYPFGIVLEDDMLVGAEFKDFLSKLTQHSDLLEDVFLKLDAAAPTGKVLGKIGETEILLTRNIPAFAVGYVIGRNASKRLLAQYPFIDRPVDLDIKRYWEHNVPILMTRTPLVMIRPNTPSDLEAGRTDKKDAANLGRFARNLRYQWQIFRGRLLRSPYQMHKKTLDRIIHGLAKP